ncbi:MAG TPA: hypothetical protein VHO72_16970 [Bacteroidales bacterium]|nr:hypothetical protein [Bacteroidales bacterium]
MEKKLTRFEQIEYCKSCKNVKKVGLTTVCGLTNQVATFEVSCEKFEKMGGEEKKEKSFFGSWKGALVLSALGFIRFALKMGSGETDFLGIMFLVLGIGWLLFAIFGNKE